MKRRLYIIGLVFLSIYCLMSPMVGFCAVVETASADSPLIDVPRISIENDSKGIMAIETGLVNQDGKYASLKKCTGMLISNSTDGVYIITARSRITISDDEKKSFFKKKRIKDNQRGYQTSIKVYVDGDVQTDPTIVAESKSDDFCILQVGDVLKEKVALHIDNSTSLKPNLQVYSLGLDGENNEKNWYEDSSIKSESGKVINGQAGTLIIHSAKISQNSIGGPLVSKEGYVIGINNPQLSEKNEDVADSYALSINRVCEILDNYGIAYKTKADDDVIKEFVNVYNTASERYNSEEYTDLSKEAILAEIDKANELMRKESVTTDELTISQNGLQNAMATLEVKQPKFYIIHIMLGTVATILFLICVIQMIKIVSLKRILRDGNVDEDGKESIIGQSIDINYSKKMQKEKGYESEYMDEKTSIFTSPMINDAFLCSEKTGGKIMITHTPFRIGKSSDKNDYVIEGNPAVSRSHAEIILEENDYYIRDIGSANGTFVNGCRVSRDTMLIKNHDIVIFADEKYEFLHKSER